MMHSNAFTTHALTTLAYRGSAPYTSSLSTRSDLLRICDYRTATTPYPMLRLVIAMRRSAPSRQAAFVFRPRSVFQYSVGNSRRDYRNWSADHSPLQVCVSPDHAHECRFRRAYLCPGTRGPSTRLSRACCPARVGHQGRDDFDFRHFEYAPWHCRGRGCCLAKMTRECPQGRRTTVLVSAIECPFAEQSCHLSVRATHRTYVPSWPRSLPAATGDRRPVSAHPIGRKTIAQHVGLVGIPGIFPLHRRSITNWLAGVQVGGVAQVGCRLNIGRDIGDSDFARQMREDRERWERQRKEKERTQEAALKQTDPFIRWFAWPVCALMGLIFLVLMYTVTPTIINAVIKATHEWQALLR
ncbi:hypothetical protein LMG28727_02937 [Paraburkholderia kirstenboschensis]|nr:hypothetical protein LMG28727_02937 [Paraburkholderia kirstenboschensis]